MRDRFIATLAQLAQADPRITLITGDLGFGVLDGFQSQFPDQFINVGVAEQNMTLIATGLALEGRIVFTYSIGNFPTLRCLEMIRNDAAYHDLPVKVVAIGGGFSYGGLGVSHHATEDLAILRALPGVDVCVPGGSNEVDALTRLLAARPGAGYLRLDKDPGFDGPNTPVRLGIPRLLAEGTDVGLLVAGGIASEVVAARALLSNAGVSAAVYSVHSLRPLVPSAVLAVAHRHRVLVSVEEHVRAGGMGAALLEVLADLGTWPSALVRIGLADRYCSEVGSQQYLRKLNGLDAESIAATVLAALRSHRRPVDSGARESGSGRLPAL